MIGGCSEYIKENYEDLLEELPEPKIEVHYESSRDMREVDNSSVGLIVTSPPYPMIEMWEERFGEYETMHDMIESTLEDCYRILKKGGIMCVNIGDAVRTFGGDFQYFPNHAEIMVRCREIGFQSLVPILWVKPTNKPNSFLGSGFMPPNAYTTLDTEYILVFRKEGSRDVKNSNLREASKFTKEQRDVWFSQQWRVKGESQEGFAVFPREIPYRLIRMFSILGDTVVDPFAGTGTTLQMARALGRSTIGYEIDKNLKPQINSRISTVENIPIEDILENFVRNEEREGFGPEGFVKNPNSLIDFI